MVTPSSGFCNLDTHVDQCMRVCHPAGLKWFHQHQIRLNIGRREHTTGNNMATPHSCASHGDMSWYVHNHNTTHQTSTRTILRITLREPPCVHKCKLDAMNRLRDKVLAEGTDRGPSSASLTSCATCTKNNGCMDDGGYYMDGFGWIRSPEGLKAETWAHCLDIPWYVLDGWSMMKPYACGPMNSTYKKNTTNFTALDPQSHHALEPKANATAKTTDLAKSAAHRR